MKTDKIEIGDTLLFLEQIGAGSPLVLLHGMGLSSEVFRPTLEAAAEFADVVFFDQRGCGRSDPLPDGADLTLRELLDDLSSIRTRLNLEKITLLGHSFGAYLALAYAIENPGNLQKLILVSPSTPYAETDEQLHRWQKKLTPAMRKEIEKITFSRMSPTGKMSRHHRIRKN